MVPYWDGVLGSNKQVCTFSYHNLKSKNTLEITIEHCPLQSIGAVVNCFSKLLGLSAQMILSGLKKQNSLALINLERNVYICSDYVFINFKTSFKSTCPDPSQKARKCRDICPIGVDSIAWMKFIFSEILEMTSLPTAAWSEKHENVDIVYHYFRFYWHSVIQSIGNHINR